MSAKLRNSLKLSLRPSIKISLSGGATTEYILTEDSDALLYEDDTFIYLN